MSELRWHPFLREWVGVAAKRQNRPQLPEDWCPFCPGSGNVPERYDTFLYPNDFAALSREYEPFDEAEEAGEELFRKTGARGTCDVVLYHPDHQMPPSGMSVAHWRKVVDLWCARSAELMADAALRYVHIFENTGVAMGVTMPHPHGQIYALPFLPPLVAREEEAAGAYYAANGECLYCAVLAAERASGARIVLETGGFTAFVPFHARWPGEVQIYPRRHSGTLAELAENERTELARAIAAVRRKYDNLWGFPIPLMMMVRQRPASSAREAFHFHVEFCPIQRSPTKLKYLAGVESGLGTFLNDTLAEDKALELRMAEPTETEGLT